MIDNIIGLLIGGVAGLLIMKLVYYDGDKFDFLKCKGAL